MTDETAEHDADGGEGRLLSLKDVERELGISYQTLLRYKKLHGDEIPSVGSGRSQRYPEEALEAFRRFYGKKRRGPRTGKKKPGKKVARSRAREGLLTLKEVQRQTGISYPTLRKYVDIHSDEIPSEGEGRRRRYPPEAVEVFRAIRQRKGKGGRPRKKATEAKSGRSTAPAAAVPAEVGRRLARIEKSLDKLAQQMSRLEKELRKPLKIVR